MSLSESRYQGTRWAYPEFRWKNKLACLDVREAKRSRRHRVHSLDAEEDKHKQAAKLAALCYGDFYIRSVDPQGLPKTNRKRLLDHS